MKVTKQQIIEAAKKSGFTDDGGNFSNGSEFNTEIAIEEYGCGDNILQLLRNLGIEIEE